ERISLPLRIHAPEVSPSMSANTIFPVLEATAKESQVAPTPRVPPRRRPVGAEPVAPGRTHFRVWAPARRRVLVVVEGGPSVELDGEPHGYFRGEADVGAGAMYRFRLDDDERLYPDPASRFQPQGPHGPSEVIDPGAFAWTDHSWKGTTPRGRVVYEM